MTGVDFHQHVWPDAFRRALERRDEPPYLRGRRLVLPRGGQFDVDPDAYAPEARLADLDRNGLGRAVVSLAPTLEPTPELADLWHAEARTLSPRLIPLAYGQALRGFAGMVLAAPELKWLDCVAPALTQLESDGGVLFVHPGPAAPASPWQTSGVSYTAQMVEAFAAWIGEGAERWPALRVVFALLGGGAPFQIERFVRRGLDPRAAFLDNVWFETSSYGERALELALRTFGAGRLVFGSDAPVDRLRESLDVIAGFGGALELELLVASPIAVLGSKRERWAA
jgi:6-methylsalicylate decarboxylase